MKLFKTTIVGTAFAVMLMLASQSQAATKLLEFDAAAAGAGNTPTSQGWTQFGSAMTNNGSFLLQDNTGVGGEQSGEYLSPLLPAGTFVRGGADYGIEFRTKPRTDVPFVGSAWGNMYLYWEDDVNSYNVTIDLDPDDAGPVTTGSIVYGMGSFSPAITGIDWSVPHDIFIGYRSGAVFDFYLDGAIQSTIVEGSIARARNGFADNRVDFGDGTTAPTDVAGEWHFVRVWDVNAPIPEPGTLCLVGLGSLMMLTRHRS